MRVVFSGLEHTLDIDAEHISVLQIENTTLFSRVCESLLSGKGSEAVEPYSVWGDDGKRVNCASAFLAIMDPFDLPWKNRQLGGKLHERIRLLMMEDDDIRAELNELSSEIGSIVSSLGFQLRCDYGFTLEWDICSYLKSFGFGVEALEGESLFDNLIKFLDFVSDMGLEATLLFVNLKIFLTEKELFQVFDHAIFLGTKMLLIEKYDSFKLHNSERKIVVEQGLLEYEVSCQSACSSSSQRRICSNGFGAVTI